MAGDRRRRWRPGCDDYDTKPVELPRLLGKIERLLGAGAGVSGRRPRRTTAADGCRASQRARLANIRQELLAPAERHRRLCGDPPRTRAASGWRLARISTRS